MKFILYIYIILFTLLPLHSFSEEIKIVPETKEQILLSYSPIVKKVSPAVVNIYTKKKVKVNHFNNVLNNQLMMNFLNKNNNVERIQSSLGSGVIVSPAGLVVSSNHIVGDSDKITVVLSDKREFDALVLLSDKKSDLALLQITSPKKDFPYIELMDSDKLEVGDLVIAIGNPFGVGQTVTSGIVSAIARTNVGITNYNYFIQTDAAINPGNSGGALVNMQGKLVGINTAIFTKSGGYDGIGFAIPANLVTSLINNRTEGGKIIRPWFGAKLSDVNYKMASALGIDKPKGAIIDKIYKGGSAEESELKIGDVICEVNGLTIQDKNAFEYKISTYKPGETIDVLILRNSKYFNKSIILSAPKEIPSRDIMSVVGNNPLNGLVLANLSPALADEINSNMQEGVVVLGYKNNSNAILALQKGDIIVEINNIAINSTQHLKTILEAKTSNKWVMKIKRSDKIFTFILAN